MAARALQPVRFSVDDIAINCGRDAFVATAAGILDYLVIELRDLDGVGIPAGREVKRVPESVVGLNRVFSENVVRGMTIVAGGRDAMARL